MRRANPAEFPTRAALMEAAAGDIAAALQKAIDERGAACAALSGGSTPEPAYIMLAQHDLDWPRVTFALVDERFVPPDHDASNEKMLRRALAPALAKGAKLAPMYAPARDVREAADIADALYAPLHIDFALMGMGEDGHTASWFDGAEGLEAALDLSTTRKVVAICAPQATGATERLTLTLAALRTAAPVTLLITGRAKRDLLLETHMHISRTQMGNLYRLGGDAGPLVLWTD